MRSRPGFVKWPSPGKCRSLAPLGMTYSFFRTLRPLRLCGEAGFSQATGRGTQVTDSFQIPRLMRPDASRTHNACAVGGRGLSPSPGGASALLGEQGALAGQAQAVAAERAASAHHAVAGDDERHRVRAAGGADGAGGPRLADGPGDFAVGASPAVGEAAQVF